MLQETELWTAGCTAIAFPQNSSAFKNSPKVRVESGPTRPAAQTDFMGVTTTPMANVTIALQSGGDHAWVIARSVGIFAMQGGFALLEAGCVRPANRANIMMKNIADMSFGMLFFLLIGYSFCFAPSESDFIGGLSYAALNGDEEVEWTMFFYHFSFAATTGTIVSGAVAGRMKFLSYIVLSSICTTNFVYPAAVHWVWSEHGWLAKAGFWDFSGTGVIHLVGGAAALLLTLVLGPRLGRFQTKNHCLHRLAQRRDALVRRAGYEHWLHKAIPVSDGATTQRDFAVNDPVNIIYGTFVLASTRRVASSSPRATWPVLPGASEPRRTSLRRSFESACVCSRLAQLQHEWHAGAVGWAR